MEISWNAAMVVRYKFFFFIVFALQIMGCGGSSNGTQTSQPISDSPDITDEYTRTQVLNAAVRKYTEFATNHDPQQGAPRSIDASGTRWEQKRLNWTSGFFAGALWQLWVYEPTRELGEQAERWTLPLAPGASWVDHDIGFIIDSSFGKAARITQNEKYNEVRVTAAENLAARYSPIVGAIRSWNQTDRFTVIIDNMINLYLLFAKTTAPIMWSNSWKAQEKFYANGQSKVQTEILHGHVVKHGQFMDLLWLLENPVM
jgi:hypothetical protein